MKKFNLEEAKAGKPVYTKDGKPVRIICFDKDSDSEFHIVALVRDNDNHEIVVEYNNEGISQFGLTNYNLIMALQKKQGWINICRDGEYPLMGFIYSTKEDALEAKEGSDAYIITTKLEWEE